MLLVGLLLVTVVLSEGTQLSCVVGKSITLMLRHEINGTGHSVLNGKLEQAAEAAWQLHVDLHTSSCGSKVLTFGLTGTTALVRAPPGYVLREGFGYYRAATHALEWTAARDACARDGATLAFANSQQEALLLATHFNFDVPGTNNKNIAWYGASDLAEEGKYATVTGLTLSETGYATYTPGAPNGKTIQNCIFIYKTSGLIDDGNCPWLLAYICKVPL